MKTRATMTRRIAVVVAATAILASLAGPVTSQDFEQHPHMLVLGLELDTEGNPIGFRKCVDLAANQALSLGAHHQHVHFGQAGQALFERAGHVVVPGGPFPAPFEEPLPWSNCAELIAFFFGD